MMNIAFEQNPLQIPEIRARVSRFVSLKDAISCACVSKAWSKDFTWKIWYAVDFKIHNTLGGLDGDILIKHGHHIRKMDNIRTLSDLNAVVRPTINNIHFLKITCTTSARYRSLCMELIYNNNKTLRALTLDMDANSKKWDSSHRLISVDALVPCSSASQLVRISLHGVCFGRDSFARLLRNCPLLTCVDLQQDVALFSGPSIDAFQHKGVVTLLAPIKQVFKPDPESEPSSLGFSLLSHFPNLTDWHCYNLPSALFVPTERIKTEVTTCCPQLSMIDTWKSPQSIIYSLVADTFSDLEHISFAYSQLSLSIIVALLFHKATLIQISAFRDNNQSDTETDEVLSEDDHFRASGRAVQLLPRSCPQLQLFRFECHEMDMDIVEEETWDCRGLQEIRVRIRGLDTKEKIDSTMRLWTEGRRNKNSHILLEKNEPQQHTEIEGVVGKCVTPNEFHVDETKDTTVEARVARHLLAFEELHTVWLGTRSFHV